MASSGGLICCKCCCCVFVVFANVLSIIAGILFAILGVLLLYGSALVRSLSTMTPADFGMNATTHKSLFGSELDLENYYASLASLTGSAAGLLIGFGVVIVIVSCIGCFGACIGIPACLIIYVVCVGLLFIGQLIAIIIWFANSDVFKRSIRGTLIQQVQKFRGESNQNFESKTLNMVQAMFGCCGVDNGTDFHVSSPDWDRTYSMLDRNNDTVTFNLTYPVSCCKYNLSTYRLVDPYCPYNGSRDASVSNYAVGCYERVWLVVDTYWGLDYFFYALCGCLGLEILLIIGALVIYCAKRQQIREFSGAHREVEYKVVQQKT